MAIKTRRNPEAPPLASLLKPLSQAEKEIGERLQKGQSIEQSAQQVQTELCLRTVETNFSHWVEFNYELLRRTFSDQTEAEKHGNGYKGLDSIDPQGIPFGRRLKYLLDSISNKLKCLESILQRLPLFPEPEGVVIASTDRLSSVSRRVFVVHGHADGPRESVARLLTQLGLEPVILKEQSNQGRTIIEKFEDYSDVAFAVVLLTPDDLGALKEDPVPKPRARQNVVFELGFFIGKLGRKKVCALLAEGVERPSDFDGILYVSLDDRGAWRFDLAKELRAAGVEVDTNKLS